MAQKIVSKFQIKYHSFQAAMKSERQFNNFHRPCSLCPMLQGYMIIFMIIFIILNNHSIQMHNRNYCCYRHFKEGKHEPTCTHCYSHVALGVINPPHSPSNRGPIQATPPLQIRSKPFRIENRTHDYNEVQHKQSLPQRLKQPRVYVQQLINKNDYKEPLLPIKHSGSNQYEASVRYFKKIGQNLAPKTKAALFNEIKNFAISNNLYSARQQNIFFNKNEFTKFILQNFNKFSYQQAQDLWRISFNQLRFKDRISMRAFVYNFGKFYLQLQNYNNTFSQTALRQRMVDMRVLLFDWFTNQICLKQNMRQLQNQIHQIQKQFQIQSDQQKYCDFHFIVESCKKSHLKMRFLAQCFFTLTDNKFLTYQKIKDVMKLKIQQKARKIAKSRQILRQYFQTQDYTNEQKFAITDLLEFCKLQNYQQQDISDIISWIQGLFDYLYFNKPQDTQLGLTLNFDTRRLQCKNILHVNADTIRQYDQFLQNLYDEQIQICNHLTALINQAYDRMPELEGHKKGIVQCNYMAETMVRFIRAVDLSVFWQLVTSIMSFRERGNSEKVHQILKLKPKQQQIKKNMAGLFKFMLVNTQNIQPQAQVSSVSSQKDKVQHAINQYMKAKQEKLTIKVKPTPKKSIKQQGQNENCEQNESILDKELKNIQISSEGKLPQVGKILQNDHFCDCLPIFPGCDNTKYWFEASRETNQSISAVESLESKLFSLLDFNM